MASIAVRLLTDTPSIIRRLFKNAVQQGRNKRRGDAYSLRYVEPLRAVRTPAAAFFNSLPDLSHEERPGEDQTLPY
ncbi:hypothetical protein NSPZN2_30346 [Nitrospira defluvii]|uniref:Uncharacterized protein n=1 Tax=Nitrospira defluvii TaxID=330214 RepID=A0ABM8RI90_9BACT|nr:hypothetical protein NSPZN2_30346 [Nitrospira defluvii]